jgi:hypothetical protein
VTISQRDIAVLSQDDLGKGMFKYVTLPPDAPNKDRTALWTMLVNHRMLVEVPGKGTRGMLAHVVLARRNVQSSTMCRVPVATFIIRDDACCSRSECETHARVMQRDYHTGTCKRRCACDWNQSPCPPPESSSIIRTLAGDVVYTPLC